LDFEVKGGQVTDYRYKLLPVFSNLIAPDPKMSALIQSIRKPFEAKLQEPLAKTDTLLYRRGNFNGSFDQFILDGLMAQKNAEIAFSPGFRWGTSLLPGQTITMEHLMDQTAITYPYTTVNMMTGEMIKTILEDVADNLFNPDPYYQQGGDMVRVGGLQYRIDPTASMGSRISEMRLQGKLLEAHKTYRVAGWAPVSAAAKEVGGEPIWDVIARHLRDMKIVQSARINEPNIVGISKNPGYQKI
jgi:sulfur-oxidizing protein SoxB